MRRRKGVAIGLEVILYCFSLNRFSAKMMMVGGALSGINLLSTRVPNLDVHGKMSTRGTFGMSFGWGGQAATDLDGLGIKFAAQLGVGFPPLRPSDENDS